jgi:hypothetical protein
MAILLALVLLAGCVLSGCSFDRWAEVESGGYLVNLAKAADADAHLAPSPGLGAVFVDREHETGWLMFDDGSVRVVPLVGRPRRAWPAGCPANLGSTRMEVLELGMDELVLGSTTLEGPVLVRDCPPDPEQVVLREDGEIGGAGSACSGAQVCIVLEPSSGTMVLPRSMKGYELYSWVDAEGRAWTYVLVTGTNRTKTWEELAAGGSVIEMGDEGWVRITVAGTEALKAVLARLPEREVVTWIGPADPRATPALAAHIGFPDAAVVREIATYARRAGIELGIPGRE